MLGEEVAAEVALRIAPDRLQAEALQIKQVPAMLVAAEAGLDIDPQPHLTTGEGTSCRTFAHRDPGAAARSPGSQQDPLSPTVVPPASWSTGRESCGAPAGHPTTAGGRRTLGFWDQPAGPAKHLKATPGLNVRADVNRHAPPHEPPGKTMRTAGSSAWRADLCGEGPSRCHRGGQSDAGFSPGRRGCRRARSLSRATPRPRRAPGTARRALRAPHPARRVTSSVAAVAPPAIAATRPADSTPG